MSGLPATVAERLKRVRLLALDVDGVLTDGGLSYTAEGDAIKTFNVKDGLGLELLRHAGVEVAVISAKQSDALRARMQALRIHLFRGGIGDKGAALQAILAKLDLKPAEVVFVGDDLLDLPALRLAGIAACPADAHPAVIAEAAWVTNAAGGRGVAREIADAILDAKGAHKTVTEAALRRRDEPTEPAFRVVIPSRMASTRLPGKPLRKIAGKSMIAHVWDRGHEAEPDELWVATDDQRIVDEVESLGGNAMLTQTTPAPRARTGWQK